MTSHYDDPRNHQHLTTWCNHIASTHFESSVVGHCECGHVFGDSLEDHIAALCAEWTPHTPPPADPVVFHMHTDHAWGVYAEIAYEGCSVPSLYTTLTSALTAVEDGVRADNAHYANRDQQMLPLPWRFTRDPDTGDIIGADLQHPGSTTVVERFLINP